MDETLEQKNGIPADVVAAPPEPLQVAPDVKLDDASLIAEQQSAIDSVSQDLEDIRSRRSSEEVATQALLRDLGERESFVAEAEKIAGLDDLETQLSDINAQIQAENKLAPARLLQAEQDVIGTGVNTSLLGTRLSNRQRDNAINSLVLSAQADVARGRFNAANSRIDRAVKAKFEPMQAQLDAKQFNLARLDEAVREGKVDLDASQERKFNLQVSQVAQEKSALDEAVAMQTNILRNQPPSNIRHALLKAQTKEEINAIPGIQDYLLSPEEKLDMELKRAQIRKTLASIDPGGRSSDSVDEMLSVNQATEQKLDLIDRILDNKRGLEGATGTTIFGRGVLGGASSILSGEQQRFAADIGQLISRESLDNLIDIKKQGATFGALSDGERRAVADAATSLSGFAIYDDNGVFTGRFNAAPKDVIDELERIQKLALTSFERSNEQMGLDVQTGQVPENERNISVDSSGRVVIDTGEELQDADWWSGSAKRAVGALATASPLGPLISAVKN